MIRKSQHPSNVNPPVARFNPSQWLTPGSYQDGTVSSEAPLGRSITGTDERGGEAIVTAFPPQIDRCDCAECLELDTLPVALRGWPDAYQLALINRHTT